MPGKDSHGEDASLNMHARFWPRPGCASPASPRSSPVSRCSVRRASCHAPACVAPHSQREVLERLRAQVPDDAFAFLADPDFVFSLNMASALAEEEMGTLLQYVADSWHARRERHAVVVPALQRETNDSPSQAQLSRCAGSLQALQPNSTCWVFNGLDVPAAVPTARQMAIRRTVISHVDSLVRIRGRAAGLQ